MKENETLLESVNYFRNKKKLDEIFLAMKPNDCVEIDVPQVLNATILQKDGYFSKNPNYIEAILPISNDKITDVMEKNNVCKNDLDGSKINYLSPAVCIPVYPLFENNQNVKNTCITCINKAFRNETKYIKGIRQLSFTVREYVFIGSEEYVIESLSDIKKKTFQLAQTITNSSHLDYSSDCFYPSDLGNLLTKLQLKRKAKEELLIPIDGKDVSVASFNFHDTSFSKVFNFDRDGEIVSGCMGVGLERFLSAYEYYNKEI